MIKFPKSNTLETKHTNSDFSGPEFEALCIAGHDQIKKAIRKFLSGVRTDENEPSLDQLDAHWATLDKIIYRYHIDYITDKRPRISELKYDARRIRKHSRKLEGMMREAPAELKIVLDKSLQNTNITSSSLTSMENIALSLALLAKACSEFSERRYKKRGETCVFNACGELWILRETLTGKQFTRSWDDADTSDETMRSGMDRRLTASDAKFVHMILHAIDPDVKMARVRTHLRKIAQLKPR